MSFVEEIERKTKAAGSNGPKGSLLVSLSPLLSFDSHSFDVENNRRQMTHSSHNKVCAYEKQRKRERERERERERDRERERKRERECESIGGSGHLRVRKGQRLSHDLTYILT